MDGKKGDWMEAIRKEVNSLLAALTPQEAEALRARFGTDDAIRVPDDEEATLRALARELAMLKKKKV
jgi:DNA-directed RNA polymerase sigma subunit (sigma70/sigma32)